MRIVHFSGTMAPNYPYLALSVDQLVEAGRGRGDVAVGVTVCKCRCGSGPGFFYVH